MEVPSRDTPCPCGSGRKYKRCCLAAEYREGEAARFDGAVGTRISSWAAIEFRDELDGALDRAIALVDERLGAIATLRERTVEPFESGPPASRDAAPPRREPPAGLSAAQAGELEIQLVNDHFARWLDLPLEPLGGRTPGRPRTAVRARNSSDCCAASRTGQIARGATARHGPIWTGCETSSGCAATSSPRRARPGGRACDALARLTGSRAAGRLQGFL